MAAEPDVVLLRPREVQERGTPRVRWHDAEIDLQPARDDDEVVVSGAQLLLSEELKYQIRNENED